MLTESVQFDRFVEGCDHPVIVVEDTLGNLVWAQRLAYAEYRGAVFRPGRYRVTVSDGSGDPQRTKVLDLVAGGDPDAVVKVEL